MSLPGPADADQHAVGSAGIEADRRQRGRAVARRRQALPRQGLVEREAGPGGKRQQRDERPGDRAQPSMRANE